jgi:hypothetical protein
VDLIFRTDWFARNQRFAPDFLANVERGFPYFPKRDSVLPDGSGGVICG